MSNRKPPPSPKHLVPVSGGLAFLNFASLSLLSVLGTLPPITYRNSGFPSMGKGYVREYVENGKKKKDC
jgi:hypothetical protein